MRVGRGGYFSRRNMGQENFNIIIVTLYYYYLIYISLLNYICKA